MTSCGKMFFILTLSLRYKMGGAVRLFFTFERRWSFPRPLLLGLSKAKNTQDISLYSNHRDKIYIDYSICLICKMASKCFVPRMSAQNDLKCDWLWKHLKMLCFPTKSGTVDWNLGNSFSNALSLWTPKVVHPLSKPDSLWLSSSVAHTLLLPPRPPPLGMAPGSESHAECVN